MIKQLIPFIFLQILFSNTPKYDDAQISGMLKNYFLSTENAPTLIGQRFYLNRGEMTFQLEIESTIEDVNDALLFSFNAVSRFTNISKTIFTHSILVMHFGENAYPTIAKTEIECSKDFFVRGNIKEDRWRKNCLTIGGN